MLTICCVMSDSFVNVTEGALQCVFHTLETTGPFGLPQQELMVNLPVSQVFLLNGIGSKYTFMSVNILTVLSQL